MTRLHAVTAAEAKQHPLLEVVLGARAAAARLQALLDTYAQCGDASAAAAALDDGVALVLGAIAIATRLDAEFTVPTDDGMPEHADEVPSEWLR